MHYTGHSACPSFDERRGADRLGEAVRPWLGDASALEER